MSCSEMKPFQSPVGIFWTQGSSGPCQAHPVFCQPDFFLSRVSRIIRRRSMYILDTITKNMTKRRVTNGLKFVRIHNRFHVTQKPLLCLQAFRLWQHMDTRTCANGNRNPNRSTYKENPQTLLSHQLLANELGSPESHSDWIPASQSATWLEHPTPRRRDGSGN